MARFWEIDVARGVAICMMATFHFLWDLNYFELASIALYEGFWGLFQKATAFTFLFLAGMVIAISHANGKLKTPEDFLRRGIFVFAGGMALTAATLLFYPSEFIYFGILHLIGVSIIFAIPFAARKIEPLIAGILVILTALLIKIQYIQITLLVWLGFAQPWQTLDFFPIFPWFGAVLLGIAAANFFYPNAKRSFAVPESKNPIVQALQFLGKRSLPIYFIHQLILFPLAYLISLILR